MFLLCSQGLDPSVMQRLPDFVFDFDTISVNMFRTALEQLSPAESSTAWGNTLRQLRQLQAPTATVQLESAFKLSTVSVLAAELPALKHLRVCLPVIFQLTDECLAALLQLGSHVRVLATHSLQLQSEQHSSAVWPWEEVKVGFVALVETVGVTQLLRLPHPRSRVSPPLLRCLAVDIHDSVMEVG